ncbi:MAG: hypothetical protein KGM99_16780 [Burkholderiales bacterium]|nr:hypothetical protein [Burkholderiales bacterium]
MLPEFVHSLSPFAWPCQQLLRQPSAVFQRIGGQQPQNIPLTKIGTTARRLTCSFYFQNFIQKCNNFIQIRKNCFTIQPKGKLHLGLMWRKKFAVFSVWLELIYVEILDEKR